ncbi:MAG: segregation/condensation protein A [Ezakiella sp.]|nr:segregation/condensation protein A [Ezakiella sp.]MDD7471882.1 segregation/condensation protein A [Bacillota bacterium]MDY3923846.1 segregation/condensation protein A [Ezakiella sp.]
MTQIDVNIDKYSGPLDLLLDLIKKNKLDIYDISINEITNYYLDYLNDVSEKNIEIRVEFLYLATTLLSIKTASLLPKTELTEDEEVNFVENLILYSKFKFQSEVLKELYEINLNSFDRISESELFSDEVDIEIKGNVNRLNNVITKLLNEVNFDDEDIPQTILFKDKYKIQDLTNMIINDLLILKNVSFKNIAEKKEKQFVITAFLAVLELLNKGLIDYSQNGIFNDIILEKK